MLARPRLHVIHNDVEKVTLDVSSYHLLLQVQNQVLLNTNEDVLNNGDDNQTVLVPTHSYCV